MKKLSHLTVVGWGGEIMEYCGHGIYICPKNEAVSMSPGIEAFDRNSQAYAEKAFWPLISKAGEFVKKQRYPCFVADSTSIRAHVGLARDIGDIDFVFSPTCDEFCTLNAAVHALTPIGRKIAKGTDGKILFARLKLPLEIAYRQERAFIVDLHFGGLVYKGNYSWHPASTDVFQLAEWLPINDLSGNLTAELPVLPLPQVLALKLEKDLGRDECDVLAGLTAKELDIEAVGDAVFLNVKAAKVLLRIRDAFENTFERFCLCYGRECEPHKAAVKKRLEDLVMFMEKRNEST